MVSILQSFIDNSYFWADKVNLLKYEYVIIIIIISW